MIATAYFGLVYLSLPIALLFFVLYATSRRKICLAAAVFWLFPAPYELFIQANCTGECNIRIDLLLVFPLQVLILSVMTTLAVVSFRRREREVAPAA